MKEEGEQQERGRGWRRAEKGEEGGGRFGGGRQGGEGRGARRRGEEGKEERGGERGVETAVQGPHALNSVEDSRLKNACVWDRESAYTQNYSASPLSLRIQKLSSCHFIQ